MLKADGFDDAIIGLAQQAGGSDVIAYDESKCLDILVQGGMTYFEAREYFDFNVLGAYVGPGTPIFVDTEISMQEIEETYVT